MEDKLQRKLMKMCKKMAGGYHAKRDVKADLEQEAMLACLEALPKYKPEDYDDPEQYFYFKALNACSKYYKTYKQLIKPPKRASKDIQEIMVGEDSLKHVEALSDLLTRSFEEGDYDSLTSTDNQAKDYEEKEYITYVASRMMKELTTEELQVITLRYFHDPYKVMTYREVSDIMTKRGYPMSAMTVQVREISAIEVLKGYPM